jgi:hypothetical protein
MVAFTANRKGDWPRVGLRAWSLLVEGNRKRHVSGAVYFLRRNSISVASQSINTAPPSMIKSVHPSGAFVTPT